MFAALLDTSVLWPSLQRDFLLSLAIEGLYRPLWSTAVLDELCYHEALKLISRGYNPVLAEQNAHRLVNQMSSAFDDVVVANWESLEGTFGLPDPDDEHVVAAAVVGGADVIVTSNLRDFHRSRSPSRSA
jgi:predicted nucleic acid-binding protein